MSPVEESVAGWTSTLARMRKPASGRKPQPRTPAPTPSRQAPSQSRSHQSRLQLPLRPAARPRPVLGTSPPPAAQCNHSPSLRLQPATIHYPQQRINPRRMPRKHNLHLPLLLPQTTHSSLQQRIHLRLAMLTETSRRRCPTLSSRDRRTETPPRIWARVATISVMSPDPIPRL